MEGLNCSNKSKDISHDCPLCVHLMRRYCRRDTLHFFVAILLSFVSSVGGMITGE